MAGDPENSRADSAADIVGCSKLAGSDEDRTPAAAAALRSDLIDPTIAIHNGRVVKRTGDGSHRRVPQRGRYLRCAIECRTAWPSATPGFRRTSYRVPASASIWAMRAPRGGDFSGDNCRPRFIRTEVRLVVVVEIAARSLLAALWTMNHSGCSSSKCGASLRAAGMGRAQRQNPTLSVAHAGSYEDGAYKVQPMRIEQW